MLIEKNIIISFGKIKDSIEYGFQMCHIDKISLFNYNDIIIQDFIANYLIIPIGVEENKQILYNDNDKDNNPLFQNLEEIIINDNFLKQIKE